MEYFVTFSQTTKDRNSILHSWLIYHNRLETTFQGGIFLNILTVFIQCGSTDAVKLTTGKHWFQHIAGIHCAIRLTCTYDQMKLINKQDDLTFALFYLFKNRFQTFLKFTTVFGTCYQCTHIQGKNFLILQCFWNISCYNSLCKTFHSGCFTNTRFTDENRIVLGLTGKNTDHIPDLTVTSDYRIQFLASCFLYKIFAVFIQCIVCGFRVIAYYTLIPTHCGKCLQKAFFGNAEFAPDFLHAGTWIFQKCQEKMLYGYVFISHCLRFIFCVYQSLIQILSESKFSAGYLYLGIQSFLYSINKVIFIYFHFLNKLENQAVFLCQEGI